MAEDGNTRRAASARIRTALQKSLHPFRAMFEAAAVGIAQTDPVTGRFVRMNRKMCDITGYSKREMLTLRVQDITHPEDRQRDWELFQGVVRGETPNYCLEKRYVRKDGSLVWVNVNMSVLRNAAGRPMSAMATIEDISLRKQADKRLHESEERLERIVETTPGGIMILDMTGTVTFANAAAERILGLTRSAITNRRYNDPAWKITTVDGQAIPDADLPFAQARRTGKPMFGNEYALERPDGGRIFVSVNLAPLHDLNQTPIGIVVAFSDITEHHAIKDTLLRSEELYRAVVQDQTELISRYNEDGTLTFVNEIYCRFFGKSRQELLGSKWHPQAAAEDVPLIETRLRTLSPSNPVVIIENRVCSGDGQLRWMQFVNRGFFDSTGRLVETQAVGRDITERKQMEEDLLASEASTRAHADELATVLAATPALTFIARDPSCQRMSSSDAALRLLRLPAGANTSKSAPPGERPETFRALKDGRELPPGELPVQRVAATGQPLKNFELTLAFDDGTTRDIVGDIVPLLEADGKVRGAVGAFLDITDRKRLEEAVRDEATRRAVIFEQTPVGLVVFDPLRRRILEFNAVAHRQLGYSREEFARLDLKDIEAKETPAETKTHVARILQEGRDDFITQHRTKTGEIRDVHVITQAVNIAGGTVLQSFWEDITERKRAEEALRDLTGRLLRSQDEERRRIARELHDTTAQQMAALCLGLSSLETQLKSLKPKVRKQIADSAALANQCLAEIRTMSYLLHPPLLEELGLDGAIRDYADGFAQRSGIHVDIQLPPEPCRLSPEDELALFRVVQECLGNIHRHSGSRTAFIRLNQTADEICLEIRDAGRGSRPFTGDGGENPPIQLGVGISGMRERLRQLGGRLELASNIHGTTVRAVLPWPQGKHP